MNAQTREAAALFVAINGTGEQAFKCGHVIDGDHPTHGDSLCELPLAGFSVEDGAPLCAHHVQEEDGILLSVPTRNAIRDAIAALGGKVPP